MNRFIAIIFVLAAVILSPSIARAQWAAPTAAPPNNNASTPVNVGSTSQTKSGGLSAGSFYTSGSSIVLGNLSVGAATASYKVDVTGDAIIRGWLRTTGSSGWYSETYGGGWYMSDTTWVRAYNNKSVYTAGQVRGDGGLCIGTDCRTSWPASASTPSLDSVLAVGAYSSRNMNIGGDLTVGNGGPGTLRLYGSTVYDTGNYLHLGSSHTYADGDISASAFYYSSDKNLKKNVEPLDGKDALANVLKLQGVSFNWKDTGRKDVGVIAQEVEKVYPELVSTNKETGLKSVEYGNLVAPLIEAIKEQQAQIDSLKQEVEALKTQQ